MNISNNQRKNQNEYQHHDGQILHYIGSRKIKAPRPIIPSNDGTKTSIAFNACFFRIENDYFDQIGYIKLNRERISYPGVAQKMYLSFTKQKFPFDPALFLEVISGKKWLYILTDLERRELTDAALYFGDHRLVNDLTKWTSDIPYIYERAIFHENSLLFLPQFLLDYVLKAGKSGTLFENFDRHKAAFIQKYGYLFQEILISLENNLERDREKLDTIQNFCKKIETVSLNGTSAIPLHFFTWMGKNQCLIINNCTVDTQNGLPKIIELLGDTATIHDFGQKIISDLAVALTEIRKNSLNILYIIDALRSDQKIQKTLLLEFICPSPKNFQQLAIKGISLKMRELIFEKNDQKLTLCRCTFYSQTVFAKLSANLGMEATIEDFLGKIIVDKETAYQKIEEDHFNYLYVTDSVKSDLEFTRDAFQEIASTSSQNMELFATFGRLLPLHKLTITSEDEQLTLGGVSIASQKALQKIISMLRKNGTIEDFLEKIVSTEEQALKEIEKNLYSYLYINDSIRSSKEFHEKIAPFIKRHKEEINSNESKNIFSNDENFIRMNAPDTLSYFTFASNRLKANLSFQKFCLVHDQSNALLFLKDINSPLLNDAVFMKEVARFHPKNAFNFAGENLKNDMDFIDYIHTLLNNNLCNAKVEEF